MLTQASWVCQASVRGVSSTRRGESHWVCAAWAVVS